MLTLPACHQIEGHRMGDDMLHVHLERIKHKLHCYVMIWTTVCTRDTALAACSGPWGPTP